MDHILREKRYFWSFVWALVLAVDLIAVTFFMAGQELRQRYVANDYNQELIESFAAQSKKADVIAILFGNSRLRHAVTFGFSGDDLVWLPEGRTLAALQFAPNAGRFDLFAQITPLVLDLKPDMVIIQDSVISNDKPVVPGLIKISRLLYNYLFVTPDAVDGRAQWRHDRTALLAEKECLKQFNKEDMDKQMAFDAARDRHNLSARNESYAQAREFIAQALAHGIKVAVIAVPPNMEALDRFGVARHEVDFFGLDHVPEQAELLPSTQDKIFWISGPPRLPKGRYCDFVHLNAQGREIFSSWLLEQVSSLSKEAPR